MKIINKKCCICGREIRKRTGNENDIILCSLCKSKGSKAKHENMINSATRRYAKQKCLFSDKELDDLKKKVISKESYRKQYGSKDEIVFALALAYDVIEFEIQKEICGHKVDFHIPQFNIAVEIDGELYHRNKNKDLEIDNSIKDYMGKDYEVLRIPCSDVDSFVVIGAENHILAVLEEKEYLDKNGFDISDDFWSDDSFVRRNRIDSKTIS